MLIVILLDNVRCLVDHKLFYLLNHFYCLYCGLGHTYVNIIAINISDKEFPLPPK